MTLIVTPAEVLPIASVESASSTVHTAATLTTEQEITNEGNYLYYACMVRSAWVYSH